MKGVRPGFWRPRRRAAPGRFLSLNARPRYAAPGEVPLQVVNFLVALWLLLLCNPGFWSRMASAVAPDRIHDYLFIGSCFVTLLLIFYTLLTAATLFRPLAKPVLIGILLIAATAASFMQQYGVAIDRVMIQNVFETDAAEVRDLVSFRLIVLWGALGLLPAALVAYVPLQHPSLRRLAVRSALTSALSLGAASFLVVAFSADYASLLRNHRDLRFVLTPTNALWYSASYLARRNEVMPIQEIVGADARKTSARLASYKPMVFVLVVGETARAEDFSLGGHNRLTNPLLQTKDGVYFRNVSACGTSTAVSLPCMFSDLGRKGYGSVKATSRENLLDVVRRAGVDVLWLDNNSGCKGVCARVEVEKMGKGQHGLQCTKEGCFDETLVLDLEHHLEDIQRDTLIVLHQKGSHGPAYFLRYPPEFERFTPTCKSIRLSDCTQEAIHNTYDNTIVYTDFVMSQVIKALRRRATQMDTAALYVSDHGESLGESGLYLHGAPFIMAPDEQIQVPLYAWFSESYRAWAGLSTDCLRRASGKAYSHDNLFHTTLSVLGIATQAYRSSLDMLAECRSGPQRSEKPWALQANAL